ncbi:MAG TPA: DMT family transporter [Nocardioidaceae bacterium]|nr:DMT family transporter [Nocardioidaceae bacterium]
MGGVRVRAVDVVLMAVGVVGVSLSGPLIALLAAVPALAIAFWRTALATMVTTPMALSTHRPGLRAVERSDLRLTVIAGVALAAHFAAWVTSLKYTTVASSTALVCLQAGWVVLFTWLGGQRPNRRTVVGLGLCLVGVLIVTGVDFTVSPAYLFGDLLALVGGIGSAIYMILGGRVRQRTDTTVYTLLCYAACSGALLLACVLGGVPLGGFAASDWALLVALAVASQLLGHSVFNHLLATISPTVVSLVILLEVPGAALLAGLLLGQTPPAGVYAGLVVLLGGLSVVTVVRREVPTTAPPD